MRDGEGRKREASKVKQTTRQSNTAHPRQSLAVQRLARPIIKYSTIYLYKYVETNQTKNEKKKKFLSLSHL